MSFLVVDDDPNVCRALGRLLMHVQASSETALSVADALTKIRAGATSLCGAIVDFHLGDGTALDIVTELRNSRVPVLIITGDPSSDVIRKAQLEGASYLPKPVDIANIKAFAERSMSTARLRNARGLVDTYAKIHGLTPRQTDVVHDLVAGARPIELPERMGIARTTAKTLTRRMFKRVGANSVADVLRQLLALAQQRDQPTAQPASMESMSPRSSDASPKSST